MEPIFLVILAVGFYFLPGLVARKRMHRQQASIWFLTLALGWTLLGWVAAMVWALAQDNRPLKGK